jgi:hypothetical protein
MRPAAPFWGIQFPLPLPCFHGFTGKSGATGCHGHRGLYAAQVRCLASCGLLVSSVLSRALVCGLVPVNLTRASEPPVPQKRWAVAFTATEQDTLTSASIGPGSIATVQGGRRAWGPPRRIIGAALVGHPGRMRHDRTLADANQTVLALKSTKTRKYGQSDCQRRPGRHWRRCSRCCSQPRGRTGRV